MIANIGSDDTLSGIPEVKMEPAVVRDVPAEVPKAAPVYTEPRVRIILEENDNIPPTGQFFGAQGVGYMLKPGMEATVPMSIIGILNTAVMSTPIIDEETKQVKGFRNRLRFPYRVVGSIPASATA